MPLNALLTIGRIAIVDNAAADGVPVDSVAVDSRAASQPLGASAVLDAAAQLLTLDADAGPAATSTGGRKRPETALPDAAELGASLHSRERLASTAIGHGVAIPHGRVANLDASRGAFLRLAEPVDFGAADGTPVDLVLALAVPQHYVQEHLQQLAEVAERFADADFRAALRSAANLDELGRRLLADDPRRHAA